MILFLKYVRPSALHCFPWYFPESCNSVLSVLFSRAVQEVGSSRTSGSYKGQGEKTPRDCCQKHHLLQHWLVGIWAQATTQPGTAREEISICLVLLSHSAFLMSLSYSSIQLLHQKVENTLPPLPCCLSLCYDGSRWRELRSLVSVPTVSPRKSPRLENGLTVYISALVLQCNLFVFCYI